MAQRKSGHVTLQDIARACGCSVSTVSIVLSKAPLSQYVAAKTREQVRAMAKQMGYHPDAYARSLRSRHSQTIGVLAFDFTDPFCIPLLRGIQAGLQPANYMPLLMDAQSQRKLFDAYLKTILERRAEGIIVIACWIFEEADLLADITKNQVPVVIVGRDLTFRNVDSILVDNERGGAMALNYLCAQGHRHIATIQGPVGLFDTAPRWRGIQQAARAAGIELDPALNFQLPDLSCPTSGFEGGYEFARQMIASGHFFSAVLAFDDMTALGVMRGLQEAGIRVPDDCSVIGFDDVLPAALTTPGLTTIRQPLHQMGKSAAQWMMDALQAERPDGRPSPRLYQAEPELVERNSVALYRREMGKREGETRNSA